ncbi:MAG: UDP-2,3-diacylglucosamine diphosphatase [bacterium]|nr:UDP-2,3-diacylglucosamine diphosphatase [bacterium]
MPVYFISDQHFEEADSESTKLCKFLEFIEYIKGKCDSLFIVGDLFDFYFEYKTQIPKVYFNILCALSSLRKTGVKIYYIIGNHDFWVGDFFTKELNISVYKKPVELMLQGKRVFIAHGDEIYSFDLMRFVLRNRLSNFIFYWLHPDIGRNIARLIARISRKLSNKETMRWKYLYKFACQKFEQGFDAVILGHIHLPKHISYKNKQFLMLGDWKHHFSYGKLIDGEFKLYFWEQS